MTPLHRYEVVEKTTRQEIGMPVAHFLHLLFCGGRERSFGMGYSAVIQVSEDMFNSVKAGEKIDLRYEKTE